MTLQKHKKGSKPLHMRLHELRYRHLNPSLWDGCFIQGPEFFQYQLDMAKEGALCAVEAAEKFQIKKAVFSPQKLGATAVGRNRLGAFWGKLPFFQKLSGVHKLARSHTSTKTAPAFPNNQN